MKKTLILILAPLALLVIAAAPSFTPKVSVMTTTNGNILFPLTLALSNATAHRLNVTNGIAVGTNDFGTNSIYATGNIRGLKIIGDGSELTGIVSSGQPASAILSNLSGLSSTNQLVGQSQLTAATNVLVDTNTYRLGTNLWTWNQYTNAVTNGANLLVLDFRIGAADNVDCYPQGNFTLALTNIPVAGTGGKSIALHLHGTNVNITVAMPGGGSLTNRFGGTNMTSYILPANQHASMGFDFKPHAANGTTFTNGRYYWITNAP